MLPTLSEGDFVLISRYFRSLNVGELVVCQHPTYKRLIKRIEAIDLDGKYLLRGDNPQSVSPEKMGWIERSQILGKVLMQIKQ